MPTSAVVTSVFQSTPPVKAATPSKVYALLAPKISIHAAREGGDELCERAEETYKEFQSTPPVKAATFTLTSIIRSHSISIHAAREGGDTKIQPFHNPFRISIHAAREGGDCKGN